MAAGRVQDLSAKAVLIVLQDGTGDGPNGPCETCGKPTLMVAISRGIRALKPGLRETETCCVNARTYKMFFPCPRAIESKRVLDQVMELLR